MKFKNDIEAQADISVAGVAYINQLGPAQGPVLPRTEKLQVNENMLISNTGTGAASLHIGASNSGPCTVQIGRARTADGLAYLDFQSEGNGSVDPGFRILRYSGANSSTAITHYGTANLTINAQNGADTVFTNTNVGIGTTDPKVLLHLRKDTTTAGSESIILLDNRQGPSTSNYYSGGLWGAGYRDVANPGYLAGIDFLRTSQSGGLSSQGEMIFYTTTVANSLSSIRASNERMRIDSIGNVGIGTDNPSELLNLSSTGPARLLIEADTDNVTETDNAQIILKQDGGAVVGRLGFKTGTNSLEIWNQYNENLIFGTNNTQRLYIQSSGPSTFTGISDYSTVKLSRFNTAGNTTHRTGLVTQNYLGAEQDTAMVIGFVDATQSVISLGGSSSLHNTATKLRFYTAANTTTLTGTERMTILSNGNVGIGATNPQAQLNVVAGNTVRTWTPTSGTSAIFESSDSSRAFVSIVGANQSELLFGDAGSQFSGRVRFNHSDNKLSLWASGSQDVTVDNTGRVGIGTDSPSEKLQVVGNTLLNSIFFNTGYGQQFISTGNGTTINFGQPTSYTQNMFCSR